MPPGTRPKKQEPVPFSLNAMGIPSMGAPGAGDSEVVGRFLKGVATNVAGTVLTPVALTADAVRSVRAGRPQGVYADLVEAAKRVSRNPEAVPGMVMNYLREQGDRMRSSPGEAAEMLGEYVNPLGIGRSGPMKKDIYVGKGSQTWDPVREQEFLANEAAGESFSGRETMPGLKNWRATQTFRGRDRRLRQEIDDSVAGVQIGNLSNISAGQTYPLKNVVNHPELFRAYPDLENMPVTILPGGGQGAAYNPVDRQIFVGSGETADSSRLLSTLLHETQHAIQHKESFARGGSPSSAHSLAAMAKPADQAFINTLPAMLPTTQQAKNAFDETSEKINFANRLNQVPAIWKNAVDNHLRITPEKFNDVFGKQSDFGGLWTQLGSSVVATVGRPPNANKHPVAYSKWAANVAAEFSRQVKARYPDRTNANALAAERTQLRQNLENLMSTDPVLKERNAFMNRYAALDNLSDYDAYRFLGGEAEAWSIEDRLRLNAAQRAAAHPYANYSHDPYLTYNVLANQPLHPLAKMPQP